MKHYSSPLRFFCATLVALSGLGGAVGAAHADPTVAVRKCSLFACESAESLRREARTAYAYSLPLGSLVFVASEHYPLSAFVRICSGSRGGRDACLITSGDFGAAELDNRVFARAAQIDSFDIPADVAPSASQAIPELVEGWIFDSDRLVVTGRTGFNPWHNLFNPLTWPYMEIYDARTGQTEQVHAGDRIVVKFADGSTAQLAMLDIAAPSGHFFHWDAESLRDAGGAPLAYAPELRPATPTEAGFDFAAQWLRGTHYGLVLAGWCAFLKSHCEFTADGWVLNCYYRREPFPCP